MNCQDLLEIADNQNVDIALHLPEYEGVKLIMVGGAITTQQRFDDFEVSLCHLFEDGIIRRYSREIGTFNDIEVLNIIDAAEQCVQLTDGGMRVLDDGTQSPAIGN